MKILLGALKGLVVAGVVIAACFAYAAAVIVSGHFLGFFGAVLLPPAVLLVALGACGGFDD